MVFLLSSGDFLREKDSAVFVKLLTSYMIVLYIWAIAFSYR